MTLSDLVGGLTRYGYDLEFDNPSNSIITDFRDPIPLLAATASDASRFASAAFQSMKNIPDVMTDSDHTAWSLIKAYYAAFYAGHAIIRLTGESCSYFQNVHVVRIRELGRLAGKNPGVKMSASAYHCVFDSSSTVVRSKSLRDGTGGSHGVFWNVLGLKLKKISEDVLGGSLAQAEKILVFQKIDDFLRIIQSNSSPLYSYLSLVRNKIQYRHTEGVWLPNVVRKSDREQLSRIMDQWKRDPMDIDLDITHIKKLDGFVAACVFLVAMCREILVRLSVRSAVPGRSFARLGSLYLLNIKY